MVGKCLPDAPLAACRRGRRLGRRTPRSCEPRLNIFNDGRSRGGMGKRGHLAVIQHGRRCDGTQQGWCVGRRWSVGRMSNKVHAHARRRKQCRRSVPRQRRGASCGLGGGGRGLLRNRFVGRPRATSPRPDMDGLTGLWLHGGLIAGGLLGREILLDAQRRRVNLRWLLGREHWHSRLSRTSSSPASAQPSMRRIIGRSFVTSVVRLATAGTTRTLHDEGVSEMETRTGDG